MYICKFKKKRFFMKRRNILALSALIIGTLTTFFASCNKDTDCTLKVTVKDQLTGLPTEGIYVKASKYGTAVESSGYTDANGQLKLIFRDPAVFEVVATKDLGDLYGDSLIYYREGSSSATLKSGETVELQVILEDDTLRRSYGLE